MFRFVINRRLAELFNALRTINDSFKIIDKLLALEISKGPLCANEFPDFAVCAVPAETSASWAYDPRLPPQYTAEPKPHDAVRASRAFPPERRLR